MIQVNLIPDLKAEFLKAQRTKRFVLGISTLVSAGFIGLVVLMFVYVNVWQQRHTNNLNNHIQELTLEYQAFDDVDKIVTVQNQLNALPGLHDNKPLVSRLVTYLSVITPAGPEYRSVEISFDEEVISLSGTADETSEVNTLANTVKNAKFTIGEDTETEFPAFSEVTLQTINTRNEKVSFEIGFFFDSQIFTEQKDVVLTIPEINSTNSEVNSPSVNTNLFNDGGDSE